MLNKVKNNLQDLKVSLKSHKISRKETLSLNQIDHKVNLKEAKISLNPEEDKEAEISLKEVTVDEEAKATENDLKEAKEDLKMVPEGAKERLKEIKEA